MADTIKIGNLDISSFKVGVADCSIYLGVTKLYPQDTPHNYYNDYLTFEAIESGTFTFIGYNGNSLSYSLDSGSTWTTLASGVNSPTVSAGSKILWKGSNLLIGTSSDDPGIGRFTSSGNFNVEGNIKSLFLGDNFAQDTDLTPYDWLFSNLFDGCTKIINAENMKFPTVYLPTRMCRAMFQNCTEMTTAPSELPALTMALNCYLGMFNGCSKLTKVPSKLPATTLAKGCYAQMFQNCSSLVTPPSEICGLAMENACFQHMFDGCSAMTTVPAILATRINNINCCTFMFNNCSSLETVPNNMLSATALTNGCYDSMFNGCSKLTTAPELPATKLASRCYNSMFRYCTSLTTAPMLPATTLAVNCYQSMFDGCSKLNSITCLATSNINSANCRYWVRGVASSGTFTKAASATWSTGNNGRPTNWTLVDYVG